MHPPQLLLAFAGAPEPGFSFFGRPRWGYFLCQFQKRAVSNCFGWPGFGQRGQNSSRSDRRRLRSSDRPLGAAGSWSAEAVRNSTVFSYGTENTPTAVSQRRRSPDPASCKSQKQLGWMRLAPGGIGKVTVQAGLCIHCANREKTWWQQASAPRRRRLIMGGCSNSSGGG